MSVRHLYEAPAIIKIQQRGEPFQRPVQVGARFVEGNDPVRQHSNIAAVDTEP